MKTMLIGCVYYQSVFVTILILFSQETCSTETPVDNLIFTF